jgi:hypothetical protein
VLAGSGPAAFSPVAGPSATSWHEASHCVIARYFALPVKTATIIPDPNFKGLVRAPETPETITPEELLKAARSLCDQAKALRPSAGESLEAAAPWVTHATARCVELLAPDEPGETDMALARLYTGTICAPRAVPAYLEFCRVEADAILQQHWSAVTAVAEALQARRTLTGEEIDEIIATAESAVLQARELARREAIRAAAQRAAVFLKNHVEGAHGG